MPSNVRIHREGSSASDARAARLILEADGRFLDLSEHLRESGAGELSVVQLLADGWFERARLERELSRGKWRERAAPSTRLVPIEPERVGKILALGKNFREHAAEFGEAVPEEPLVFNKLPETLRADGETVRVPTWYEARFDHEVELAVVIGRAGHAIAEADAMAHVGGYTIANDLTARTLQGQDRGLKYPWFRSKNFEGSCPLGPCLAPRDFLDISGLRVSARVRHAGGAEELRQDSNTRDLIVTVPAAIAWLSRQFTLRPGDVLLMGTPAGVGPLVDGDETLCAIEGLGELRTKIARG